MSIRRAASWCQPLQEISRPRGARTAGCCWLIICIVSKCDRGDGREVTMKMMIKRVRVFASFAEADQQDAADDARLTPEERIRMVIELRDQRHPDAAQQGLARVCRVVELERS